MTVSRISIGRVYDDEDLPPGFRVLVDRLWPRGIRRDAAPWDAWWRDLTPSHELRRWVHADPEGCWQEFVHRYRAELSSAPAEVVEEAMRVCREGPVVLLTAARNPERSHASVLRDWLLEQLLSQ